MTETLTYKNKTYSEVKDVKDLVDSGKFVGIYYSGTYYI